MFILTEEQHQNSSVLGPSSWLIHKCVFVCLHTCIQLKVTSVIELNDIQLSYTDFTDKLGNVPILETEK